MLRRVLVLLVQLYLTADYCDPSVPGVFYFESQSYFVDSLDAKSARPSLTSPASGGVLPVRRVVAAPVPRAATTVRPGTLPRRHSPRSHLASASTAPASAEEH